MSFSLRGLLTDIFISQGAEVRNAAARQNRGYTVRRERLVNWRPPGGAQTPAEGSSNTAEGRPFSPSVNVLPGAQAPLISSAPPTMTSTSPTHRHPGGSTYSSERSTAGYEGSSTYTRHPQSASGLGADRQRPSALNLPSVPSSSSSYQDIRGQGYSMPRARSWMEGNYTTGTGFSPSTAEASPFSSGSSQAQSASYPPSADFFTGDQQVWNLQSLDYSTSEGQEPCSLHSGADLALATCQYCGFYYVLGAGGEILGTVRKRFDSQHSQSSAAAQQVAHTQFYPSTDTAQSGFVANEQGKHTLTFALLPYAYRASSILRDNMTVYLVANS